jgi:hypothetical protein
MDKLALLTQILAEHPTDAFTRYGLAMEYVAQSRIPEGLAEFDRCIAQTMASNGQREAALVRLHEGIAAANRTGNQHALAEMDTLRDDLS